MANGYFYCGGLFILCLFLVCLAFFDVYPFGSYSMASYDMLAQIAPFYEHFFDVLSGHSSLFYTFSISGGTDVFGTFAYFAVSPFSFIYLLGGPDKIAYMVPFALIAKMLCVYISGAIYLKKVFPNINNLYVTVLAIVYSFGGYLYVANTYSNWVDFMIYIPFLAFGFQKLVKEKKIRYFVIATALMLYTCFSIASFSLFILFPIYICYCLICVPREERKEMTFKVCYALLIAIAIALPILLSAFVCSMNSGRNTGLFENLMNNIKYEHLYSKLTYIFSDFLLLSLSFIYFVRCAHRNRFDFFLLVAIAFIFCPVFIDECCNLLNAGSYMSYSLRFGFLNTFLSFYLAAKLISEHGFENIKPKAWKTAISCSVIVILFAVLAVTGYLVNDLVTEGKDSILLSLAPFKEGTKLYSILEENDFGDSFSASFAHSTGGLEAVAILFGLSFITVVTTFLFIRFKMLSIKVVIYIISFLSLFQVIFDCSHLVYGNRNTLITYDQYKAYIDVIKEDYGADYTVRIKDYSNRLNGNLPFMYETRSISVFSSVINAKNFKATSYFNYKGNGKNSQKSAGGNLFSDCLFGYEYAFATTSTINRGYLKKMETIDGNPLYLYKNLYAFPQAFTIPKGEKEFKTENYLDQMDELYKMLGGTDSLFIDYNLSVTTTEEGYFRVKATGSAEGNSYFYFNFPDGIDYKFTAQSSYTESSAKVAADYYDFGYYTGSRTNSVCIKQTEGETLSEDDIINCCAYKVLALDRVIELYELASSRAVDIDFGSNTYNAKFAASEDCYLFICYFNIGGFTAKNNGKTVNLMDNDLYFLIVEAEEGENDITVKYSSPYFKIAIIGLLLGAIIAVGGLYLYKKKYGLIIKLKTPVFIAALALGVVVVGFFFLFPTGVYLYKLVAMLF